MQELVYLSPFLYKNAGIQKNPSFNVSFRGFEETPSNIRIGPHIHGVAYQLDKVLFKIHAVFVCRLLLTKVRDTNLNKLQHSYYLKFRAKNSRKVMSKLAKKVVMIHLSPSHRLQWHLTGFSKGNIHQRRAHRLQATFVLDLVIIEIQFVSYKTYEVSKICFKILYLHTFKYFERPKNSNSKTTKLWNIYKTMCY